MLSKVKDYFGFMAKHWPMTLVFVLVVTVFLASPFRNLYAKARTKLSFLPAAKPADGTGV